MRRRAKTAMTTVIMVVIAVGAIASVPPSTWREAEDAMRRHLLSVEAMARPTAELSAEWFERQKHALRDRLGGIEVGAGKASQAGKEQPVRIVRGSGALTGPARVIDGDTLDMGGVRIRLHGIDAPESEQSCRVGGNRWSCGREATRALGWVKSADVPLHARSVIGTATAGSWRCAASPGWISTRGWSRKAGPSPTGDIPMRTLPRSPEHGQRDGACGAAKSCHRGIGVGASVLAGRGRQLSRRAGGAPSRATSARTARASTTCRVGGTTTRRESIPRRGSGGSAPRPRHARRDGGAQDNRPRARGAVRRPCVWCARQSRVDGSAPLGRYRTIPGTRMQLYPRPLIHTVGARHVKCRRWARPL